ncbi:MAG: nicotinate-nucleotide adenylyltransferase [Acidimicrobiales bacterium]|nr:nicotinate-nucleotide adenylyltransferase [Acidimicrobiales bacterium]
MQSERIGVFGGTFDPLHNGHLMIALEVREALDLDRMLLVVANDPWQKTGSTVTPAAIRLEMAIHAVAATNDLCGATLLEVSDVEVARGGETYSADTLEQLRAAHPSAELFLVVGSDAAVGLDTWKRPDDVRELASTVVVDRGGREGGRPPEGWPHEVVDVPVMEVSSSDLRNRFATGRPVAALVPHTVIGDVAMLGLYGTA